MIDLFLKGTIGVLALAMVVLLLRSRARRRPEFRHATDRAAVGSAAIVLAKIIDVVAISSGLWGWTLPVSASTATRGASAIVVVALAWFVVAAAEWLAASKQLSSVNESVREHRDRLHDVSKNKSLALSTVPAILYRSTGPLNIPGNTLKFLNDSIEEILGYSVAELEASPSMIFELIHPDDRKDYESGPGQKVLSRPHTILEHRFRHRNGEYRWIRRHISRILDEHGNFRELIGCGVDISDLKDAERRLHDLLDSSPDAVITVDPDHVIVLASTRATTMFGYSKDELIGRHVRDLVPAEDLRNISPGFPVPDTSGKDYELNSDIELFGRRQDGSVFPAEIRISAVQGGDNHFAALAFRDITDRKETEAKLLQAQKMEAVGQLTGGIAHDFNNMLLVILGNLQMLELEQLNARAKQLADAAVRGAEHAADLTGRLLAFSRQQILRPSSTQVPELLDDLEPLLRQAIGEDKTLDISVDEGLFPIYVDAAQLESSLVNLCINARDAMGSGGKLRIAAENVLVGDSHEVLDKGDYVKLSVNDTGAGIPEDALPHVFEPFFTTKEVGRGTGLGLSMVYGFVTQSKGYITVSSKEGNGTTFEMLLPRYSGNNGAACANANGDEDFTGGTEQILLVEDNCAVRDAASELLKSLNYRVLPAGSAACALELLEQRPDVDLLFTDIVMPGGMSGLELAVESRKRRPDLKVLFTTGYAHSTIASNDQVAPRDVILDKPYRRNTLARSVRVALDQE